MNITEIHESGTFYWEPGAEECPHAAEPNYETEGDAWDVWTERHPASDNGRICLDAPAGEACLTCSEEEGDMVPWSRCRGRDHIRPLPGLTRVDSTAHASLTVLVGGLECLERECEEFFTDDGDEIPGKTTCSHMHEEEVCGGCSVEQPDGIFESTVAWVDCPQRPAVEPTPAP
ncbi:hypothetical protein [Streptomyces sp. NPDC002994]|uniref:hypothetical protein n=1 Tax=Streptomyces sp. NPDC002994 TaxID=3154441 RepID=UPI0033B6AAE0